MRSSEDASGTRYAVAILRAADAVPKSERMSAIREGVAEVPTPLKTSVENAVLSGLEAGGRENSALSDSVMVGIGLPMILLTVVLSAFWADPSDTRFRVMGLLVSIGAAFMGAALPGIITVELTTRKEVAVRATGSLGLLVFSVLYWIGVFG